MGLFDSLFGGRKKDGPPPIIERPQLLEAVTFTDIDGNTFQTVNSGTGIIDKTVLSDDTQRRISSAQGGIDKLLQDFGQSDSERAQQASARQRALYNPLKREINAAVDTQASKLRSQASKRFGGSLNSSFSSTAITGLAKTRLNALESAFSTSYNSALQELASLDQARQTRFSILSSYLDGVEARKQRYTGIGFDAINQSRYSKQQSLQSLQNSLTQQYGESPGFLGNLDIDARDLSSLASLFTGVSTGNPAAIASGLGFFF